MDSNLLKNLDSEQQYAADLQMYRGAIDNNEIADKDLNKMIIEKINEENSYRKKMIEAFPEIYNIGRRNTVGKQLFAVFLPKRY